MIKLLDISKTFKTPNSQLEVLKNINLEIEENDIFGIIGLSGAGKSTLIRTINFLETPSSGQVIFDGKNLGTLTKKELRAERQKMGMIFQNFCLLSQQTVLKNIMFPLEIAKWDKVDAKKRALELLEIVGMSDKKDASPSQLSGGQKQRVAIARALATNPKVLLCDEATSALDPNTTVAILELLKKINKELGVTILVVTHEMSVIEKICNKVALIHQSEIVETGNVKDVFMQPSSDIAKQMILPNLSTIKSKQGNTLIRLIFDGSSTYEPIISAMSLECEAMVSILSASTKVVEDKLYGEMVLRLPEDEVATTKIQTYLKNHNITFTEERV